MCLRPAISATVGTSGGAVAAAIDAAPGPAEWGSWGGLQGGTAQPTRGVGAFPAEGRGSAAMAGAGATVTDLLLSRQQQRQQQQQQQQQEDAWADYRQQWERQRESQGPTTFMYVHSLSPLRSPAVATEPLLPSWQPLPSQQPLQPLQQMGLTLPTVTPYAAPPLVSPSSVVTTTGVPGHAGLSMGAVYPGMAGHGAVDEKKVKRMMSNRASAKRSRKRRQERLEELEVLSASLHVDNASAQRRLNEAQDTIRRLQRCQQALQRSVAEAHAQLTAATAAATAAAATAAEDDDGDDDDDDEEEEEEEEEGDAPSSAATPSAAAVASGGGGQQSEGAGEMLAPLHPLKEERLPLRTPLDLAGRLRGGMVGGWGGKSGAAGVDAEEEQNEQEEEEEVEEEEGGDEDCGDGSEEVEEELEEGAVGGESAEAETGVLSGLEGGIGCEVAAPAIAVDFDSLLGSGQGIVNPNTNASASSWMNSFGHSMGRVG
ncbi:unnamed protein product [Closterium sp. NIES-64]|nr:unnamed protein product [Closterium sp. NIES-64]